MDPLAGLWRLFDVLRFYTWGNAIVVGIVVIWLAAFRLSLANAIRFALPAIVALMFLFGVAPPIDVPSDIRDLVFALPLYSMMLPVVAALAAGMDKRSISTPLPEMLAVLLLYPAGILAYAYIRRKLPAEGHVILAAITSGMAILLGVMAAGRSSTTHEGRRASALTTMPTRKQIEGDAMPDRSSAPPPSAPVERMRATISTDDVRVPTRERKRIRRLFRDDTFEYVDGPEETKFVVTLKLELSTAERAIIREHELDDIVIEDEPLFTEADIDDIRLRDEEEIEATSDPILREVKRQSMEQAAYMSKEARLKTTIGDLLVSPFTRSFDSRHEAKLYADKLKTKLLPAVKETIESYRGHKKSETIEF